MPHRSTQSESDASFGRETIQVLVGPEKKSFTVHKKLLCSTSKFFGESLAAIPTSLLPSPPAARRPPPAACRPAANNRRSGFHDWTLAAAAAAATASATGEGRMRSASCADDLSPASPTRAAALWFSEETPEMFELFVLWLYHRRAFAALVDEAVTSILAAEAESRDSRTASARLHGLHWALVNLHLFAVEVGLPVLQDLAMDAVQDLTLQIKPIGQDDPAVGDRNGIQVDADDSTATQFQVLLSSFPEFCEDYSTHLSRMHTSRANPVVKNPQLRIPTNALRNEERHFGFRMCSFHSHRASVGQGRCPHDRSASNGADIDPWSPVSSESSSEAESDMDSLMSDFDEIVSPVSSQGGFDLLLPSELLPPSKPCSSKPSQPPAAYGAFLGADRKRPDYAGMRRVTE
ncbi:hypothetical protein MAPG_03096 [Magnaporthiopsis poae ATCC 64411]|uniref:BTB domain-containing protein n=1 Tax=Magnaporthiopsis poae (strain ATCC 64411 / 73-15) TaxID=644358 RepID=A0A0C4DT41_MAGP6|nr:hypothetical protein MAPG_03096 [Magnaporthiopsis poae ATCC 64411]